jgi:hypothetical protein
MQTSINTGARTHTDRVDEHVETAKNEVRIDRHARLSTGPTTPANELLDSFEQVRPCLTPNVVWQYYT